MYLISLSQQTWVLQELRDLVFQIKTEPGPIYLGVNSSLKSWPFYLGLQKGLSITETEFAERS